MTFALLLAVLSPSQNTAALALSDKVIQTAKVHTECVFKQPTILEDFWKPTDSAADVAEASIENCSRAEGSRWKAAYDLNVFLGTPDAFNATNADAAKRRVEIKASLVAFILNARAIAAGRK